MGPIRARRGKTVQVVRKRFLDAVILECGGLPPPWRAVASHRTPRRHALLILVAGTEIFPGELLRHLHLAGLDMRGSLVGIAIEDHLPFAGHFLLAGALHR